MSLRARTLLALASLAALPGCYELTEDSTGASITWSAVVQGFALGVPLATAALGVLCLRRRKWRVVGAAAIAVAVFAATVAGFVFADEIRITDEEVYDHHGFPWERKKRGFRFEEVERVTFHEIRVFSGRSYSNETVWALHRKDGERVELQPGDLWDAAREEISARLEENGVRVGDDPSWYGFASDDPFVVTRLGREVRLDAASPRDRFDALTAQSLYREFRSADGERALGDAVRARGDLAGRWTHRIADGPRALDFALDLRPDGTFEYTVTGADGAQALAGTYRLGEHEFTLVHDGSSHGVLLPER